MVRESGTVRVWGKGSEEAAAMLIDGGMESERVMMLGEITSKAGLDVNVEVKDVGTVRCVVEVVPRVQRDTPPGPPTSPTPGPTPGPVLCGDTELRGVDFGDEVSVLWADRNVDVRTLRDGTEIGERKSAEEWAENARKINRGEGGMWCHYDNDEANCEKWGKIYFIGGEEEGKQLAPEGWRLPTYAEWRELLEAHGLKFDADGELLYNETEMQAAMKALREGGFKMGGGSRNDLGAYDNEHTYYRLFGGEESL
jgi:uncharacterized protein (TIGR02145 family)